LKKPAVLFCRFLIQVVLSDKPSDDRSFSFDFKLYPPLALRKYYCPYGQNGIVLISLEGIIPGKF